MKKKKITKLNENKKILKITKFISTNDLASLMNVPINKIISTCMSLGIITSINQRLDEETIIILADEFGYNIEFTELKEEYNDYNEIEERKEKIEKRPPIITIMGHVDHGKTSLLNYIKNKKKSNKKEIGNITQHIGAYSIKIKNKEKISFLDTPGHEAFTAMRARGVKVTDIAVIVIAADDGVKLQTKEAINHAKTARVPIIIAINKSDKEEANPSKIKEELANINILVEEWGGKYQSQEISAITGKGIDELLEKIIIEAELLELKVNVNKNATGAIIESSLNKGRGYESIILIQSGTLKIGDKIVSGIHYGKIKAMFNYEGLKINKAKPSESIRIIGLNGAPQAGDVFKVMNTDKKIKEIAKKREQIIRDQNLKTRMNINLNEVKNKLSNDETLKELNIIIKGDVNGSIEAIADSLLKLSIEEIKINIIHKGIGQISESDVLLASTSNSMIIGFQVKLSNKARKISKKEEIKIKMYSIIYDIIDDIKESIEKILSSKKKEIVTGSMKIKEIFKISNIKTIAGCYVTDGYIKKINKVKVVRDDVVIHIGKIKELKRFKDEIKEIKHGFECGINIENFNNVKIDDIIESFE
ncbi:MAG: translation initiation factor IF-2 [Cytophagales bacterium]